MKDARKELSSQQQAKIACKRWDGGNGLVEKIKYETLDDAIEIAKKINRRNGQGKLKMVSYKCNKCFKYHIGSNGKTNK